MADARSGKEDVSQFQRCNRPYVASNCRTPVGSKNVCGMFITYLDDSEFIPAEKKEK